MNRQDAKDAKTGGEKKGGKRLNRKGAKDAKEEIEKRPLHVGVTHLIPSDRAEVLMRAVFRPVHKFVGSYLGIRTACGPVDAGYPSYDTSSAFCSIVPKSPTA